MNWVSGVRKQSAFCLLSSVICFLCFALCIFLIPGTPTPETLLIHTSNTPKVILNDNDE
jgi:hypothetical protein